MEMPSYLLALLREYYRAYRPKNLLFNGKRVGSAWAQRSAQWAIKHARSAAGVGRPVSPHVFRHCYATHHLENGTNLVYLKEQLGHKHLKTTACTFAYASPIRNKYGIPLRAWKSPTGRTYYRPTIPGLWRGVHKGIRSQPPNH